MQDEVAGGTKGADLSEWHSLSSFERASPFKPDEAAILGAFLRPEADCEQTLLPVFTIFDAAVISDPAVIATRAGPNRWIVLKDNPYLIDRSPAITEASEKNLRDYGRSCQTIDHALCLCGEWSTNIWHWFTEFFPYAVVAESRGFRGSYLIQAGSSLHRESLLLIGIEATRIVEHSAYLVTLVRELLIFQRVAGQQNYQCSNLVIETNKTIRSICGSPMAYRRLYVARRSYRVLLNEEEVFDMLKTVGFEKVYMEDLSMIDQFSLGASATHIIGPHGAGLVSALYMRPGGTLLEFFSPEYINPCMLGVCISLRHRYLQVTSPKATDSGYPHGLDIRVDLPALRASLQALAL